MLTIRSIDPSELASWAALDDRADQLLLHQVEGLLARGATRPDWLLLAEQDGVPIGRLGVAAEPLATVDPSLEYRLFGLWLPWDDGPRDVGRELVDAAVARAIPPGRHPLDLRVNPELQPRADIRRDLAEATGFSLFQEKDGFLWSAEGGDTRSEHRAARLRFRSVEEVGRDVLASVMGRCLAGSLDRVDRHYAAIVGPDAWGREMLGFMEPDDAPTWKLAETTSGDLAGYILLGRFDKPTRATIVHIGVVPEHRGRGYVDELLREFNRMARARGFLTSLSDVDVDNGPMRAAMERNSHHSAATVWHVFHYRRLVDGADAVPPQQATPG